MQLSRTQDNYLQRAQRLSAVGNVCNQLRPAFTAAALAAWVILLGLAALQIEFSHVPILISLASLLVLVALMLPTWVDWLHDEADRLERLFSAESTLISNLSATFDDSWHLFFNLPADRFDRQPDCILLGPHACVAIDLVSRKGTYQNNGSDWRIRDRDGNWRRSDFNPTERALASIQTLCNAFDIATERVEPALLWCEGLVLHDDAKVPVWLLQQIEPMVEWIDSAETITPEQSATLKQTLLAVYPTKSTTTQFQYAQN